LPGDVYGLDGYFRVGIGGPRRQPEQGLERISDYFLENAPSTAASEKD